MTCVAFVALGGLIVLYNQDIAPYLYRRGWISYTCENRTAEMAVIEFMDAKLKLGFEDKPTSYTLYLSHRPPLALARATANEDVYYLKTSKVSATQIKVECISAEEFGELLPALDR